MKHKKLIATITLLLFAITLLPTAAFAATPGTKVTATIPTFKVTMNGQVVDNTYRQYPFLVYNDITYFPMTYWDMRFLGVSNTWSAETGSVIVADGTSSEYKPTLTDVKNKTKNTATVNTGAFKVNGKVIDNAKEEYPILSFRDVPYFPLTWNWCQEFGWNISFDGTNGLAVNTTTQKNISDTKVETEIEVNKDTDTDKLTISQLQSGCWLGFNTSDDALFYEVYKFDGDKYSCVGEIYGDQVVYFMEEGTYALNGNTLKVSRDAEYLYIKENPINENLDKQMFNYSLDFWIEDEKLWISLNDFIYVNVPPEEAEEVYSDSKHEIFTNISNIKPQSTNSSDYAYLAGTDFRSVQRDYPHAEAQCAYVYAYKNIDGDICVLTYNRYKIKTNWDETRLHNITTGEMIINPSEHYENLADRSYGGTKIHYMDLQSEVDGNLIRMTQAMSNVLQTGNNTFDGVFVDADTLNM